MRSHVKGRLASGLRDAGWALIHAGDRVEGDDDLTKLDDELNAGHRIGFDAGRRSQGVYQEGRMQGRREMLQEMRGRGPLRPV